MLPIETPNPLFGLYKYPFAKEFMEKQQDISWTAQEIAVDKDKHTYLHVLSPEQLGLVTFTLQLFVEIEQKVGEVWNTIASWFPHSEIEGCCLEIARMEKAVHAFFYQKMSDVLNIDPELTAHNQATISVLKSKLDFLKSITSNLSANKPRSLATVAIIEQVLLFSNFAMLKSFQSNGHNLITNTITGVDFVTQDEQVHGDFASALFNTYLAEDQAGPQLVDLQSLSTDIVNLLQEVVAHEDAVIDYTFGSVSSINDITPYQLKQFIRSRANDTLALLNQPTLYTVTDTSIATWFHRGAKSIQMHDFFVSGTSQYRRSWSLDGFSRLPHLGASNEH